NRTTPVLVKGIGGVGYLGDGINGGPISQIATASGYERAHSVALKSGGSRVYAWGRNNYGQLGDRVTTNRTTPIITIQCLFQPFVVYGFFDSQNSTFEYTNSAHPFVSFPSVDFYNLRLNNSLIEYILTDNLNIYNDLEIIGGVLDTNYDYNYSIDIGGDWYSADRFISRGSMVRFSGIGEQGIYSGGNRFYNLTIDKSSGKVILQDRLDVGKDLKITNGILNGNGKIISIGGDWVNRGDFISGDNTVELYGSGESGIYGSNIFYNFICNSGGKTIKFEAGSIQRILGGVYLNGEARNLIKLRSTTDGNFWDIEVGGVSAISYVDVMDSRNISIDDITAFTSKDRGNNIKWWFVSSVINWEGDVSTDWGDDDNWDLGYVPNAGDDVIIGNSSNRAILDINRVINSLRNDTNGVIDLNGKNLTISTNFTNRGILRLIGTEEFVVGGINNIAYDGMVEYYGNDSYIGLVGGNNYYNLKFSGSGSYTLTGDLEVNKDLDINSGTLIVGDNTITIFGNFSNLGTFDAGTGEVIFSGILPSTISGENIFNDFICTSEGKVLYFEAGKKQTIRGRLILRGEFNEDIVLRSTIEGIQWDICPEGEVEISYVDIKDSNNVKGDLIIVSYGKDSGNNDNWFLAKYLKITGDNTMVAGLGNEIRVIAYDWYDNISLSYQGEKNLIFSGLGIAPNGNKAEVEGIELGNATLINFIGGISVEGLATLTAYKCERGILEVSDGIISSGLVYGLNLDITPGELGYFIVEGIESPQLAGTLSTVSVRAYDIYDNIKTDYLGEIVFSSSDSGENTVLPPAYRYVIDDQGEHTFFEGIRLTTAGIHWVKVMGDGRWGMQSGIEVTSVSETIQIQLPELLPELLPSLSLPELPPPSIELPSLEEIGSFIEELKGQDYVNEAGGSKTSSDGGKVSEMVKEDIEDGSFFIYYEDDGDDEKRRYKRYYRPGKYRTSVIVFEGKVIVSPYDEMGPKDEGVRYLNKGDNIKQEGEVK
ncbi:MAG: hypothetical protein NC904_03345, partial [Candidatus Omnitrophica bacterium]|nr:hypothetical protein [Candidatus Omnitrophota bacterium]